MRGDQRGEVFPVAILFGGVLLTILIGLHVVLVSVGRTAVQAAANRGVTAALREADRAEVKSQFRWLVGIVASFGVSILAAVVTPMAVSLISG